MLEDFLVLMGVFFALGAVIGIGVQLTRSVWRRVNRT